MQDEIDQLGRGLVGWEMPSDFDGAPELGVQGLDRIRRVHDMPHGLRKGEERNDLVPVSSPGRGDGWIFSALGTGRKGLQRRYAGVGVPGSVEGPQLRHDRLPSAQDTNSSEWRIR
jgi:hypothetical protein